MREFQLEGAGLVLVGALVVGALLVAFFAGRWYERGQHGGSTQAVSQADPLAHVELPDKGVDVSEKAGFFDLVEGGQKEAEPAREVRRDPPVEPATSTAPGPGPSEGEYYVQVFAGRDEQAAANLVTKLKTAGHPVRLHTDRQGTTTLYKVRVGGFGSQERARAEADRLQEQGYAGAWVTRVN